MTYRILITFLATMALSFLAGQWLPWWSIVIAAALVAFLSAVHPAAAFLCTFTAGFALWLGLAWWMDNLNASILSIQIGDLFKGLSPLMLIIITGILGGLTAGLGGLTGSSFRQIFQRN